MCDLSIIAKLEPRFGRIEDHCQIVDTLAMARQFHPGQKNNLDALCKRYQVDNSQRELHGALLDAEILADVYLAMTGGQVDLGLRKETESSGRVGAETIRRLPADRRPAPVIRASVDELRAHGEMMERMEQDWGVDPLWTADR